MSAATFDRLVERGRAGGEPAWARGGLLEWLRPLLQRGLLAPAVRAICRPLRVEGVERLRGLDGPCLFVANHSSHLDAPAILAALPAGLRARTRVAAAEDYFYQRPALGVAVTLLVGGFPFPRRAGCGVGLARAAGLLADGWNVLIFPEGTRSADGRMGPFRGGAARLALAADVPIVPIGLVGTRDVLAKGAGVPLPGRVTARFGAPWRPEAGITNEALTAALAARVARLADRVSNTEAGPARRRAGQPERGR